MLPTSIRLLELYDFLKRFHLSESLYQIGSINSLMKYGTGKYNDSRVQIPREHRIWFEQNVRADIDAFKLTVQLTQLSRFLLLSRSNDYKTEILVPGTRLFEKALHLVGEVYEEFPNDKNHPNLSSRIIGRITSWQIPLQANRLTSIGRAYLLFVIIPSELNSVYDFDAKMQEYYGIGIFPFMATGIALWIMSNGTVDFLMKNEIRELRHIITPEAIAITINLISQNYWEYRQSFRGSDNVIDIVQEYYGMNPLLKMPAIKVTKGIYLKNDSIILPQAKYLMDKFTTGIFYLLADYEQKLAKKSNQEDRRNDFRNEFGFVYREYVKRHLQTVNPPYIFIDLDDDFNEKYDGKKPDYAIIHKELCILFEVKTTLIDISTRTLFSHELLSNAAEKDNFKKSITQLDNLRQAILNGRIKDARFANAKRVINILVCYEEIYVLNAAMLPILKALYGTKVDDFQLASVSDIDSIGKAIEDGLPFDVILANKISAQDPDDNMIGDFFKVKGPSKILDNAYIEFMGRLGLNLPR